MKKEETATDRIMGVLGSYGLAVVLLSCLFVLTVLGTLYQVDYGLFEAKDRFFLSWILWWSPADGVALPVFPGGITCMLLLSINLIVGGLVRLRIRKRNIGVVVVHVGVILILLAGLVKTYTAEEGHLRLFEGQEADYFQNERDWEVAIWEITPTGDVPELVIESQYLVDLSAERTRTFTSPDVPFELVLSHYLPNSRALPKGPNWEATGPVVDGYGLQALGPAGEGFRAIAGMHAEVRVGGESQRGILWGLERLPWSVRAGGKDWAVSLRPRRYQMPFSLRLEDFQKEDHPGITMAKAFRSFVTKTDDTGSERILIQMNEPLRHDGLVLFQSSWGPEGGREGDNLFSVFSVVRNPSDQWPLYSLWVITAGLVIAFGMRLFAWVKKQIRNHALEEGLPQ